MIKTLFWLLAFRYCTWLHAKGNNAMAWYMTRKPTGMNVMIVPPASLSDAERAVEQMR